jgi:hypothetical protein
MRVNAGDSIPVSGKERQAPRDCGCKRERGDKLRGKKVFRKILGMGEGLKVFVEIFRLGEWAPLFLVLSSPTPLSISPRGFYVEHALHGLGMC